MNVLYISLRVIGKLVYDEVVLSHFQALRQPLKFISLSIIITPDYTDTEIIVDISTVI